MGHTFVDLYKKANTKKESCVTTILKELFVEIELSVVWLLHLKYDHIRTLTALLRAERSWEYEHSMDLVGLLFTKLHTNAIMKNFTDSKNFHNQRLIFSRKNKISHSCLISYSKKHSLQILPSWLHLVSSAHHWCLAPIDIANLWNTFNRIRIIMEEFGCAQIRTSSSCSCERKWGYRGALWSRSGLCFAARFVWIKVKTRFSPNAFQTLKVLLQWSRYKDWLTINSGR